MRQTMEANPPEGVGLAVDLGNRLHEHLSVSPNVPRAPSFRLLADSGERVGNHNPTTGPIHEEQLDSPRRVAPSMNQPTRQLAITAKRWLTC